MPILTPAAPYDSLETVTSLTRTILGDYIQGLVSQVAGTVNTNGLAVTWVSGDQFTYLLNGETIVINGASFIVQQVTSATTLILQGTAGVQAGVTYVATLETGDIFADSQAYVLPTVNLAWRKLQKKLADKGHPRLQREADLLSLPVVTNLDPISEQWIDWTGFFDGTNFIPGSVSSPFLPGDFLSPRWLKERQTGMNVDFRPMHPAGNGLRLWNKSSYNCYWDWREDKIFLRGSLLLMDVKVRYSALLPDITLTQNSFPSTPIPIANSADALAYYSAEAFVSPRGGALFAPSYAAKGDAAVDQLTNEWAKTQQRGSFHRQAWGWRGRRYSFTR